MNAARAYLFLVQSVRQPIANSRAKAGKMKCSLHLNSVEFDLT